LRQTRRDQPKRQDHRYNRKFLHHYPARVGHHRLRGTLPSNAALRTVDSRRRRRKDHMAASIAAVQLLSFRR